MNELIWIAQIALAGVFLTSGTFKLFAYTPMIQALQGRANGPITLMPTMGKLIGVVEAALAFGVVMPDVFTPEGVVPEYLIIRLSAAGLALLMVGRASFTCAARNQPHSPSRSFCWRFS